MTRRALTSACLRVDGRCGVAAARALWSIPFPTAHPTSSVSDRDDERIFRRWFTFLAEAQYFQPPQSRPEEIVDCAALIRYAYREALRTHDARWAAEAQLTPVEREPIQSPHTTIRNPRLVPNLFRIVEGPFDAADLKNGAFAQFADVKTSESTTPIASRATWRAPSPAISSSTVRTDHMPFHSMIYLGPSHFGNTGLRPAFTVYHTGPDGGDPGIIRRLTTDELLRYPEPEWRPIPANPNFLGVYRWNILRTPPMKPLRVLVLLTLAAPGLCTTGSRALLRAQQFQTWATSAKPSVSLNAWGVDIAGVPRLPRQRSCPVLRTDWRARTNSAAACRARRAKPTLLERIREWKHGTAREHPAQPARAVHRIAQLAYGERSVQEDDRCPKADSRRERPALRRRAGAQSQQLVLRFVQPSQSHAVDGKARPCPSP